MARPPIANYRCSTSMLRTSPSSIRERLRAQHDKRALFRRPAGHRRIDRARCDAALLRNLEPESNAEPWPVHDGPRRLRSEEHTSELQSLRHLVCRLLLEKKKTVDYIQ